MNKETIYEEFFNVVSDSTEWGIDTENCKYGYYIDGATSMAQALLDRFDKKETSKLDFHWNGGD